MTPPTRCWAIRLAPKGCALHGRKEHRNSYAGILMFGDRREPPPHLAGFRTALFRTQREARLHCRLAWLRGWADARAERVTITLRGER